MIFRRLELDNFGIFYGTQELDLKSGLYVLHGENGRGKTTLINAVKWVFYGGFEDRQGRPVDPRGVLNLDAKAEEVEQYSVALTIEDDDGVTTLARRTCDLSSASPEISLYVERAGQPLNQAEAQHTLRNFLEKGVSRFFLFDAEQLREYEELLFDDNESARLVKRSIEQILGLPVLEHAIADVRAVKSEVEKKIAKIARQNAKTEKLSFAVEQLETAIAEAGKDLQGLESLRAAAEEKAKEAAAVLQENEASQEMVKKMEAVELELEGIAANREAHEEDREAALAGSWRDALVIAVGPRRESLEAEVAAQTSAEQKAVNVAQIERSLADGCCDLCGQEIDDDVGQHLRGELEALGSAPSPADADPRRELASLAGITGTGALDLAMKYDERVSEAEISRASKEQELEQIRFSLGSAPAADIRLANERYGKAMQEIGDLSGKIADKQEEIAQQEQERQKFVQDISDQSDSSEMTALQQSEKLAINLIALIEEARGGFRDNLRAEVEKDASEIFTQLTTEPTYAGLRINDSYGLETLGPDGEVVPGRSAGQEQIVAMALIGALNRNAARRAPVMMDTPFARLDETHRANVFAFLSRMADQVFLLVHSAEVGPDDLVAVAAGTEAEFILKRGSTFSTEILPSDDGV